MTRPTASVATRTLLAISTAVTVAVAASVHHSHPIQHRDAQFGGNDKTFDYVVIGAGTGGLTMATRLAEGCHFSVAVIEAGGYYEQDNGNLSVVPGYTTYYSGTDPSDFNPLIDWGFVTEPQRGLGGRRLHYTRGKTLGGTSARNYMYYQRPTIGSMDKWAEEVGDDSYKFENLLPFYKKSVHYTSPVVLFANSTNNQDPQAWSSTGGPLQVSHGKFVDSFGTWVQPAAEKLGMPTINGLQSGTLIGNGYVPYTVDPEKAQRSSSESSFLRSLPEHARLRVFDHTLAEKILLDRSNRATGVVASSKNATFTVRARKEVILSAGVFQSPQLLMLSGIGPEAILNKHNIPVRVRLSGVGSNLQDHPWFGTQHRVRVPTASALLNDPSLFALAQQQYNDNGTGPLTIPASGLLTWEKVPSEYRKNLSQSTVDALDASFSEDWPELEVLPIGAALGYNRNYQKEDPMDGYNYATLSSSLVAPLSRGTVSISSTNAADPPVIDPAYLTHPGDAELAVVAVRRQRELWALMQDVVIGPETLPGEDVVTDEEILQFVKDSMGIAPHASSTCRMGKKDNPESVVDNLARVYGTRGLRVVDTSVFPFLPPGHVMATVYAIAEKISDAILKGS
ncbi:MAG: hypothetical protein Q9219_002426 [cf. Caloplaca sp. 3 TL-2023]